MKSDQYSTAVGSMPNRKTVGELEEELRRLKEKEKSYLRLARKMQDLEERSKTLKKNSAMAIDEKA